MDDRTEAQNRTIFISRLVIGLLQGLALYFLYVAFEDRTWPATDGLVFAPCAFLAAYVPLVVILGIGNMRIVTLVLWSLLAGAIVAGLAWYDIWHNPGTSFQLIRPGQFGEAARILPAFATGFFASIFLFIAQSLVMGGDQDRRFIAQYSTHFDVAWKLGLQLLLAANFVGVFWGVLLLGAELFHIIGIDYFQKLIEHRWFSIPATTLAHAAALHLTDVRAGLVRGMRTVVLVLLSWLLPLMAIIGAGFLASLVSTGLTPLWNTRFAAGYLLISAGILVFLINAAYQDGDAERTPHVVLRYAGSLASILLLPLVALSGYAIYLRVAQYGWTTDRVGSAAVLAAATSYAVGYALAAIPSGAWLARIARWNFFTALLVLVLIGAIFSPVADPVRISVDSQVSRLMSGKIDASTFDFRWLRWFGGRFGTDALKKLAGLKGAGRSGDIRKLAAAELADRSRYNFFPFMPVESQSRQPVGPNIAVYPAGRSLPAGFLQQAQANNVDYVPCLRSGRWHCNAYLLDLAGDHHTEVALIGVSPMGGPYFANGLYAQNEKGEWVKVGRPDPIWACPSIATTLKAGKIGYAPPPARTWRSVSTDGRILPIVPTLDQHGPGFECPK